MRSDLPPLPERMKDLPIDARGYPVPWFVAWRDGQPLFQVADQAKWFVAVQKHRCWLCGGALGVYHAFVVGPMCGINRVTAEPPSHRACAEFGLKGCPFLTRPAAKRTTRGIPDEVLHAKANPGGEMIERNPGVSLLWITKNWKVFKVPNGRLISLGEPTECLFFSQGRLATKDEVLHSVSTGLPLLQDIADKEGVLAQWELARQVAKFTPLLERAFAGAKEATCPNQG